MARILLVDDDCSVRTVVSLMLERRGHAVDVASSGEEALTQAATNPPDLVMSDLCMPGMAGDEVLRKMKQAIPSAIRMLMTGDLDQNGSSYDLDAHHLRKPFSMTNLLDAVESALGASK